MALRTARRLLLLAAAAAAAAGGARAYSRHGREGVLGQRDAKLELDTVIDSMLRDEPQERAAPSPFGEAHADGGWTLDQLGLRLEPREAVPEWPAAEWAAEMGKERAVPGTRTREEASATLRAAASRGAASVRVAGRAADGASFAVAGEGVQRLASLGSSSGAVLGSRVAENKHAGGGKDVLLETGLVVGVGRKWRALSASQAKKSPNNLVGRIAVDNGDSMGVCTGTLVGHHVVLTAAHCLAKEGTAEAPGSMGDVSKVTFTPGRSGSKEPVAPFGSFQGSHALVPSCYLTGACPLLDVGVVCLAKDAAVAVGGYMGYRGLAAETPVEMLSYPAGTKDSKTMWHDACSATLQGSAFGLHTCDTEGGSSGAALLERVKDSAFGRRIVGVHTGTCQSGDCNVFSLVDQRVASLLAQATAVCEAHKE